MKSSIASPALIFLLALASAPLSAQNYTFSTFAGSLDQAGETDGTGTAARFSLPRAIALDGAGNLFVCSAGGTSIRKVSPAGVVTTVADLSAFWHYPGFASIAVDSAGNLFLGDEGSFVIRRLSPSGTLSTFAGSGVYGSADGSATVAQFMSPSSMVFDSAGNLFVRDSSSIRKITPAGNVSTFAGSATATGSTDGTGTAARFSGSIALGIDRADNLYATDKLNQAIRKITPSAVVTTFAGRAGYAGSGDGVGTNAHFFYPDGISVDGAGNIFVADTSNATFRRITPGGVATTIGGTLATPTSSSTLVSTGTGANARFTRPSTILASSTGTLIVLDGVSNAIYQAVPDSPLAEPLITKHPLSSVTTPGSSAAFSVEVAGTGLSYQWKKNGTAISGAVGTSYTIASASAADAGNYAAVVTNRNGSTTSFSAVLTVDPAAAALTYTFSTIAGLAEVTPGLYPPTEADGNGTGNEAQFLLPSAVTIDSDGNLFVLDFSASSSIRKITPSGVTTRLSLTDSSGAPSSINGGYGLAADRAGNLFASDLGRNALLKITPAGVVTTVATQLAFPKGVAVDNAGNAYVASLLGNAVFKVTAGGVVSTLVNTAIASPQGVAVDGAGNVYIADTNNSVVRKLTPSGALSILAGSPAQVGGSDGTGTAARFRFPQGIAVDSAGNVFVADTGNNLIRRITTAGVVNTIGGSIADGFVTPGGGISVGYRWADGVGANARFTVPSGIAVDSAGNLFIADKGNNNIRRGTPVATGAASNTARLSNVSIRAGAGSDSQTLIVGLTIGGAGTSGSKTLLVRGTGPALTAFGVPGALADPVLNIFSGTTSIANNDDWSNDPQVIAQGTALGAFALTAGSKDSALVSTIPSGGYTVQLTGKAGATGVGLVEVYDATSSFTTATPRLTNVSARTQVGTGGNILITGFVVAGTGTRQVLIRATGPALAAFGVAGTLADPKLELYNGAGAKLDENDNWTASTAAAQTSVGAFALAAGSKDSVIVATLTPGNYTVQVSGVSGTTGVALVEVYEVP